MIDFAKSRCSGFSLIESLGAVALLVIVLGAAYSAVARGGKTTSAGILASEATERARLTLDRITQELHGVRLDSLGPAAPQGSGSLSFQTVIGFGSGGEPVLGDRRAFRLIEDDGDPDDGTDNDGDGVVDEKRLVFIRDVGTPSEQSADWMSGIPELAPGELPNGIDDNGNGLVDEPGFSITLEGNTLAVHLAVEKWLPTTGRITRELETSLAVRN